MEAKPHCRYQPVMPLDELWPGEMKACLVSFKKVLLVNSEGTVSAFEDKCPHKGVPMSQGFFKEGVLTCAGHLWEFSAVSGEGLNPEGIRLKKLPVKIEDGCILVSVEHE